MLPAYNKYIGGVDRLSQVRKSYGFDRKSKRYWVRAFFQFFYYIINNAYLLYKHNCRLHDMTPRDLLDFRIDLMKLLIRPGKHVQICGPSKPKLGRLCKLLSVSCGRSWTMQRKVPTLYGRRNTFTTSYHLCLLLLQSSSLQNPMFADFHKH